jgi:hypothetical protein
MSIRAWLRENRNRYGNEALLRQACMEQLGVTNDQTYQAIKKMKYAGQWGEQPKDPISQQQQPRFGINEAQLRQKHDIGYIINQKLLELKPGSFYTESEFVKMCNIRGAYRTYLDGLTDYRGKASGITYYAHPDSIRKMKMEGILQ